MIDLPEIELMDRMMDEDLLAYERFWDALWANYVRNKGTTSLVYWMEQFSDPMMFNGVLFTLQDLVKTVVIPERNWAEVQLDEEALERRFGVEALIEFRKDNKLSKYTPEFKESRRANLTKTMDGFKKTGLLRKGFAAAANTQFYYDVGMLQEHKEAVIRETNKGMRKMRDRMPEMPMDEASYDAVATRIVEQLAEEPELMTMEGNVSDSRGRAIKGALRKVANPIGYKCFRALLTIPHP